MSVEESRLLRCDLHCHSLYSDGVRRPEELALAMKQSNVEVFALTDHDTLNGVAAAQAAARTLGITCLAGIELSIQWDEGTFHLLGLGMSKLESLQQHLNQLNLRREERNQKILGKLAQLGVDIRMPQLLEYSARDAGKILNRSHIARYLVDFGYCGNWSEAFEKYLGHGAAAYIGIEGPSPEEGMQWIRDAGGWSFIAHPYTLKLSWPSFRQYVESWCCAGLSGLELSHPRTKQKDSKYFLTLCQKLKMQYCGGSDYHSGETKNVLGLGTDGKTIEIPAHFAYFAK